MDDGKLHQQTGSRNAVPEHCVHSDAAAQMDVHRMLAYAAGKRAITLDESIARAAVAVTGMPVAAMTPDERLDLYRVHDTLAATIAPATPDGVRTLDAYQQFSMRDRRSRAVLGVSLWALGGLTLAISVHAYVATGSLIVQTIETTRKDVAQVQAQIRDFDAAHPRNTVLGKDALVDNAGRENERQRLRGAAKSLDRRFDTAHDRLTSWFYLPLGTLGLASLTCADDRIALQEWSLRSATGSPAGGDVATKRQAIAAHCGDRARELITYDEDTLSDAYYKARQAHEQNARAAMEMFSVVVLPLVFGLLGASVAVLRDVNRRLHEGSLDLTTLRCAAMRRVLGSAVGGIVGIFFTPTHVLENWGLSLVALAFLLGFSVDIAFRVFQRLSDRVADAVGGGEDAPKAEPSRR